MSQAIKLEELPVHQLQAVRQQLEEEIQTLTQSFAQLKQAQAKFNDSIESLKPLANPANESKDILVPLTTSISFLAIVMFISMSALQSIGAEINTMTSQLADIKTVIVDSVTDATDFYKRKVEYLKLNLEKLQETVVQRQNQRSSVVEMIQMKLAMVQKESSQGDKNAIAAN
ncbi:hypothetical protein BDEG_24389 [Batrachochytrium dendrobatidis JEL423]|uniref:Prefoldin, alpha subunit n=1 Tax=Batrachochytrium dendrobatidis (strain JEL423) TaxID=403673 RepID=A0A177WLI2_BATDL|nr:hypothetical protein BDEG_24389 [Batrachochytrium dendrobatidis JEL423]